MLLEHYICYAQNPASCKLQTSVAFFIPQYFFSSDRCSWWILRLCWGLPFNISIAFFDIPPLWNIRIRSIDWKARLSFLTKWSVHSSIIDYYRAQLFLYYHNGPFSSMDQSSRQCIRSHRKIHSDFSEFHLIHKVRQHFSLTFPPRSSAILVVTVISH